MKHFHLNMSLRSIASFNEWREDCLTCLSLTKAHLKYTAPPNSNLCLANLSRASLLGANLFGISY